MAAITHSSAGDLFLSGTPSRSATHERLLTKWELFHSQSVIDNAHSISTVACARVLSAELAEKQAQICSLSKKITASPRLSEKLSIQLHKIALLLFHIHQTTNERVGSEAYYCPRSLLRDIEMLAQKIPSPGEVIGRGACGTVSLLSTKEPHVCLKSPNAYADPRLLIEEAIAYSKLPPHPGILHSGLLFEGEKGDIHLLLEKAEGSVGAFCRKACPEVRESIPKIFYSMADALAFIHSHHLVFRDFKPDNILRMIDGRFVLADLEMLRPDETRLAAGTIGFAAPEVYKELPVSYSADVFSFGAALVYSITGKTLITSTNPHDAIFELFSLTNETILERLGEISPTDSTRALVERFGEALFKVYDLIDPFYKDPAGYEALLTTLNSVHLDCLEEAKELLTNAIDNVNARGKITLDEKTVEALKGAIATKSDGADFACSVLDYAQAIGIFADSLVQILESDISLLLELFSIIGTTPQVHVSSTRVRATLLDFDGKGLHLASMLLKPDPSERSTIEEMKRHPFFTKSHRTMRLPLLEKTAVNAQEAPSDTPNESAKGGNPFARGASKAVQEEAHAKAMLAWKAMMETS